MTVRKHWLYGEIKLNVNIEKEDSCAECIHWQVCKKDFEKFCLNFNQGRSTHDNCDGCIHRFTRYDKDHIPCFKCKFFMRKEGVSNAK